MRLLLILFALSAQSSFADAPEMLTKALREGDLKTIETILSLGVDPNSPPDRTGYTPLGYAIELNQTREVELLLAWHADPNAPLNSRFVAETPLHYAVHTGNLSLASILIAGGAQIDAKGREGRTALHIAVADDRLDALHLLLEKSADPTIRDAEGASPLDDAVWRGSIDAVAILLAHRAPLNDADTQTGATPVNEAAYRGNTAVLRFLLQFRPDLGITDKEGRTPLDNTIRIRKEDCAILLLGAEPKENVTPGFLRNAMQAAVEKDESRVVDFLLRLGISSNDLLTPGITPLSAAASAGAINVVRVLLAGGGDPNLIGRDGSTPLENASLKGFETVVGELIDHGALVNQVNTGSGTTALYAAAAFGKANIVQLLLGKGANPALCGSNHKSPYQAAVENGYVNVAEQIRSRGGGTSCR